MIAPTECCMEAEGASPLASNAQIKGDQGIWRRGPWGEEEGRRERESEWMRWGSLKVQNYKVYFVIELVWGFKMTCQTTVTAVNISRVQN